MDQEYLEGSEYLSNMVADVERADDFEYEVRLSPPLITCAMLSAVVDPSRSDRPDPSRPDPSCPARNRV